MRRGLITGAVLKLGRESTGLSQEGLAHVLELDRGTIQGWESARRPFTAVPYGQAVAVRHALTRLGADTALIGYLDDAAEADFLLAEIAGNRGPLEAHPLGYSVLTRRVVELVDWVVTGGRPAGLPMAAGRRGPAADGPIALPEELQEHAAAAQDLIERSANGADDVSILLHRQAAFLAGPRAGLDSQTLLTSKVTSHLSRPRDWTPHWSDARTVSITRALKGDPEPLNQFLQHGFSSQGHELANLNYWAYYLGEVRERQVSDTFQLQTNLRWRGARVLGHLAGRLDSKHPLLALNVHTVWSLLSFRRGLIHDDPVAARALMDRCQQLLEVDDVPQQTRIELASIVYANRSELR